MKENHISYKHLTNINIRFNDIDMIGHVNNAIHQEYFDQARLSYFQEIIGETINWKKFALIMATIKIDFFSAIEIHEMISVRTSVEKIGEKSLTMVQELFNTETQAIKSFNRAVLVAYSVENKSTQPIPEIWKDKISGYEESEHTMTFKYPIPTN
jgi:acyl-CoA thioester hydrolase